MSADRAREAGRHDGLMGLPEVMLAALEQTRSATCITTSELDPPGPEIVYVNPAYCAMTGHRRDEVIGRTPRIMQGPLTDRAVLDRLRADLGAGRSFSGQTVNYRADGVPFIISWSVDPVRDRSGEITHFVATQQDVTDQVRATNLLAAVQQLDRTLTETLRSAMDADAGLAEVVAEVAAGARRVAAVGAVTATVHDDGRRVEITAGDAEAAGEVLELPFELAEASVRGEIRVSGLDRHHEAFLDRSGLGTYVERAGIVVAALLEYQRQRDTALRLQRDLLPAEDLLAPDCTVIARYLPGTRGLRVGGDWYDVAVAGERVVFSVGDVCGSGVDAAALMGRLRLRASVELERGSPIGEVMAHLGRICESERQLATMLAAELDRRSGEVRLWSAGHLPPVLLSAGGARMVDLRPAPPLGYVDQAALVPAWLAIEPGEGLLLFTDGLIERRGESLDLGLDRLVARVRAGGGLDELVDRLVAMVTDGHDDDVAILAFCRDR